jgi:hypothetical protein
MMNYTVTKNNKTLAIVLIVVGALSIAYGFGTNSVRAWASLLLGNFYFMCIAVSCLFFVAFQYAANVGWSAVIKRIPMAVSQYILLAGIFMIIIFIFGHHTLYSWTHPENYDPNSPHYDKILSGKTGYLNMPFFVIRMVLYFAIWYGFAYLFRKESIAEDLEGGELRWRRNFRYSAIFLVLYAVTSSTSAWDFIMSIDAHWFSTLFGWYTFAGLFVTGMTALTLLIIYLKSQGYLPEVNENHIHNLGLFMFAFSIFWTYLWFSQFMLIWYANLPEEVTYFMFRQDHYRVLFVANFVINFGAPFLMLVTRDAKRKYKVVVIGGILMLIGHWIDNYMMIMPGTVGEHWTIGITEIGTTLFFAGAFLWFTFSNLAKAPLVAKNHPMIEESIHHHI